MKRNSKTIDDYIAGQPDETRKALTALRSYILKAAPHATELFNYGIPAFALVPDGKREQQIMIAGYENHVGLYPHPTVIEHFDKELEQYRKGKGSVQFPLDKPLPEKLILEMVKYRLKLLADE